MRRVLANALAGVLACGALAAVACSPPRAGEHEEPAEPGSGSATEAALEALRAFERERRAATDFARLPPGGAAFGPDPFAVRPLPAEIAARTGARFVGTLRGRDAVVLLDGELRELARAPAPDEPTGLAVTPSGEVLVVGEGEPDLARYRVERGALVPRGREVIPGVFGLRDVIASEGGVVHLLDRRGDRVLEAALDAGESGAVLSGPVRPIPVGAGPVRIARTGRWLLVACLVDHALEVLELDARGRVRDDVPPARIRHDGPIWSFDAVEHDGGLVIAAGGVEDRPLDRTGGSFGNVDSFAFLYELRAAPGGAGGLGEPRRLAEINVAAEGVVTPKALALDLRDLARDGGAPRLVVTGYGGDRMATIAWRAGLGAPPAVTSRALLPGTAALVRVEEGGFVAASPLFDAWARIAPDERVSFVRAPDPDGPARSEASRIGEALVFTTLIAPWNRTEGELSRFTCETCHFEGYVDGRTHHTGRGDVRATTKPIVGLFNNRPHFSRALDPDLASVAHNEFRVAGARSGKDPWFSIGPADVPWLAELGVREVRDPVALRKALMTFLMELGHRRNPAVRGRSRFTEAERAGAELFRDRCETCHAARLASDEPSTRVPFEAWEAFVLSAEGPIVWGRDGYEKTGVEPYVHERGARVPSLRRLHEKRPYFTNGSAKDLDEVLLRARVEGGRFVHDAGEAPRGEPLSAASRAALRAFLELL